MMARVEGAGSDYPMPNGLTTACAKPRSRRIDPAQGVLDLGIFNRSEIRSSGMGVLSDGTPFLTQRGLARLCGVRNAHIGTISARWNESRRRIERIRALLSAAGVTLEQPHVRLERGTRAIFAYPQAVCLAVLEYYAFHAGSRCREEARHNFRALAGSALHAFICTQTGYAAKYASPRALAEIAARITEWREQARPIPLSRSPP
jgi:hypothetical protein